MKNLLAVIYLILAFAQNNNAQTGNNHSYDFNLSFSQLKTILVDNDTIVFVGNSPAIDSPYTQSALIGRIDTLGNVLAYNTIKDPMGDYLDVGENIIKTSDNIYAFHSAILFRNSDALYKFDKNLLLQAVYEFLDTINLSVGYRGIVGLEDGYLLSGYVQRPNHKYDAFARRIDNEGNTLWYHFYGQYEQDDIMLGMSQLNDSLFAITGASAPDFSVLEGTRLKIWMINSSGQIQIDWAGPDDLLAMGIFELETVPSGGYIAFSRTFSGYNQWDDYQLQPTLIKLGQDLNIEWIKLFGPNHSSFSIWHDMKPTPDGNFIGVGRVAPYDLADLNAHLYGWMYKFTPEGDSIWARADLSTIPYQSGIDDNVFGGVGFLSSGSVVAGGNSYINGQIYGWIVKVTPDGCIDTLLCQSSAAAFVAAADDPKVFPNPASGQAHIRYALPCEADFRLYDVIGRPALRQALPAGDRQETFSLAGMPEGIYFWQITMQGRILTGGKLMVR